ncbi:NAD(P)-binding protein [Croceicoccus marinus]|uniref:FAD-dependent monooxygenase n=1 Tax=Croceicoccus marinus TaxID=450378 RepID=A0A7G6VZV9_9SPHN|nr:FAD-dependent monooxygenase [Croceicoccus marinus]
MSRSDKILIVGAGIGGLCAAIALVQNGSEVDVIDIKPDNSVAGVGWGLRTNGLRALREIGILEKTLGSVFRRLLSPITIARATMSSIFPMGGKWTACPTTSSFRDLVSSRWPVHARWSWVATS